MSRSAIHCATPPTVSFPSIFLNPKPSIQLMEKDLLQGIESNFVTRKALRDPFLYSSLVTNGEVYEEQNASSNITSKTRFLCLQNYVLCSMCTTLSKQIQNREAKPKRKMKERAVSSFVQDHLDEYDEPMVSKDSCIQHYHDPPLEAVPITIALSSVSSSLQDIVQETEMKYTLLYPDNHPKADSISICVSKHPKVVLPHTNFRISILTVFYTI